jgi:excisionase family DNA binding protein
MKVTIPPERILYTSEEAAAALGIGVTKVKTLIRSGEIRSLKIGRLRRITVSSLREFVVLLEMDGNEVAE